MCGFKMINKQFIYKVNENTLRNDVTVTKSKTN